jgi:prepilin-type N-terminal cleavage/methylation domain-containing protein/prepilin-type processing-associated H-X9-DG protein
MGKPERGTIMNKKSGFTLIELLVVIAIIAVLMAILMPALSRVREQGKRIVCEHNLKSLTLAWVMYSDENDDRIVNGAGGFHYLASGSNTTNGTASGIVERAWVGKGWGDRWDQPDVVNTGMTEEQKKQAIREGALWSVCSDYDAYKCPTGRLNEFVTYAVVDAMNGLHRDGTWTGPGRHPDDVGARVGKTTLWIKKMSDISSPAPALRMVYIDEGAMTPDSFATHYRANNSWWDDPPIRHGDGTTVSWADGHAGHLKWRAAETIEIGRRNQDYYGTNKGVSTPEGIQELKEFQKSVWGKNG